jgi:hypothetical protein
MASSSHLAAKSPSSKSPGYSGNHVIRKVCVVAPASRCLPRELGRSLNVPVTRLDALYYDEQWDPLDHEVNRRQCL